MSGGCQSKDSPASARAWRKSSIVVALAGEVFQVSCHSGRTLFRPKRSDTSYPSPSSVLLLNGVVRLGAGWMGAMAGKVAISGVSLCVRERRGRRRKVSRVTSNALSNAQVVDPSV
jgi:hypothetical protein